jgi:hypothetical protein
MPNSVFMVERMRLSAMGARWETDSRFLWPGASSERFVLDASTF